MFVRILIPNVSSHSRTNRGIKSAIEKGREVILLTVIPSLRPRPLPENQYGYHLALEPSETVNTRSWSLLLQPDRATPASLCTLATPLQQSSVCDGLGIITVSLFHF